MPARPDPQLEERYRVPLHATWLTIPWVLGLLAEYKTHLKATVYHVVHETEERPLVPMTLSTVNLDCLSEGMGKHIIRQKNARWDRLKLMLFNSQLIGRLCFGTSETGLCSVNDWTTELCHSTMLGSMLRFMSQVSGETEKVCTQGLVTVSEIADILRTIKIPTWNSVHECCPDNLRLKELLDEVLEEPLELLDAQRTHFESF